MSRIESSIAEMLRLQAIPVHYDMSDRYANDNDGDGRIEMDCSSAVSCALGISLNNNTETLQQALPQIGYTKIYDAVDGTFVAKRGIVVIWAPRDGSSSLGSLGHVMIFINDHQVIHCNYFNDGITIDDYDTIWEYNGRPREIVFEETNAVAVNLDKSIDQLVQEVLIGLHGNGEARKVSLGDKYQPVMDIINGKANKSEKTDEELAREVIAGKHGNGDQRKQSLGGRYDSVMAIVNDMLKPKPIEATSVAKAEGDLAYNGAVLKQEVLDKILVKCKEHDILPSYAITVLHFEGLWGTSAVGQADNNWGGMTWTGKGERPSGVTVTQGTARPSVEGGHYMHYSSVDDFLTDWFYLLRQGGSYKVAGAKTFSEAVKGMFRAGGAVYDYAASGFESYLVGASSRLKAIEAENGSLDKYDQQTVTDVGQSDKIDITIDGIEVIINGETYTLSKKTV
ncbi:peptidoglycan amidohydrolase family protein [Streptococcus sp. S784/96/1]|uniref:peptidoglycan amidohydrolase family protein n=1 Tax=Streptococcus sp. S784/96/1 TaxID=2653499 RepID=UPI0013868AAE|nr:peptidoglycan amidohydrolase family protein [Streptococcus sp. S784/96/1]